MPRTTVNIDGSVLRELKRRAREEHKSLGEVISEIATAALAKREAPGRPPALRWKVKPMGARVDLEDKEALHAVLDEA